MICSDLLIMATFCVTRNYAVPSFLRTPELARVVPREPVAEISGDRLDEGQWLVLVCRRAGGLVSWEYSSNVSNPYFTVEFKKNLEVPKYDGNLVCEDPEADMLCDIEKVTIRFTKNQAGLYRCIAPPKTVFNVLWINQTLSIAPQIVPHDGYGKSVSIPCNAHALPSAIGFDRVMTWSYTDPSLTARDVASCCGGDYIIEAGVSPGPAALVIRSFNATRHAGKYRCTVKIDGYPKELAGDAIVYAEVALTFTLLSVKRGSVLVLPDFVPNKVVKIRPTDELNVSCTAMGYPLPQRIELYETNSSARGTTSVASSTTLQSILAIGRVDDGYRATFVCQSSQTGIPSRAEKHSISRMTLEVDHLAVEGGDGSLNNSAVEMNAANSTIIIVISISVVLVTVIVTVAVVVYWRKHKMRPQRSTRGHPSSGGLNMQPSRSRNNVRAATAATHSDDSSSQPLRSAAFSAV